MGCIREDGAEVDLELARDRARGRAVMRPDPHRGDSWANDDDFCPEYPVLW